MWTLSFERHDFWCLSCYLTFHQSSWLPDVRGDRVTLSDPQNRWNIWNTEIQLSTAARLTHHALLVWWHYGIWLYNINHRALWCTVEKKGGLVSFHVHLCAKVTFMTAIQAPCGLWFTYSDPNVTQWKTNKKIKQKNIQNQILFLPLFVCNLTWVNQTLVVITCSLSCCRRKHTY